MLLQETKSQPLMFLGKEDDRLFFQRCGCGTYCWHTLSLGLVKGWDTYSDASTPSPLELNSFGHEMRWQPIADNAIHDNWYTYNWYNCTPERNSSRRCHARHENKNESRKIRPFHNLLFIVTFWGHCQHSRRNIPRSLGVGGGSHGSEGCHTPTDRLQGDFIPYNRRFPMRFPACWNPVNPSLWMMDAERCREAFLSWFPPMKHCRTV